MAGDWIKMRTNLWDDPRISQICEITEQSEATVIGAMYWLWATADQHTDDGFMPGLSCSGIDRKVGIRGFANALVTVGWLIGNADSVTVARFLEHNGASAKARAQTARRVSSHKLGKKEVAINARAHIETSNAANDSMELTLDDRNGNAVTVTNALPREEKRREEKTTTSMSSGDDVRCCPVGTIINLYHECMPLNPQVRVPNEARKKAIRARWLEASKLDVEPFCCYSTRADGLEAWRQFFTICAQSRFLTGRSPASHGRAPFVADIDFLMSPSGFAKTLEEKYHRDAV